MAFDLGIDPETGELDIDADGEATTVSGPQMVAQKVELRLDTQKGSWWADLDLGVDYRGVVFVRPYKPRIVRAAIAAEIRAVEEVVAITALTLLLNPETRELVGQFEALTDEGAAVGVF